MIKTDLPYTRRADRGKLGVGRDLISFDGKTWLARSSNGAAGIQVFANSRTGELLKADNIGTSHPELAGKFDTIILHDQDYEAVKLSMMDQVRRDRERRFKQKIKSISAIELPS